MFQVDGDDPLRFIDLFAGLGGFHRGLERATQGVGGPLSFECVLASELDDELRSIYPRNFTGLEDIYRRVHPPDRVREMADHLQEEGSPFADALPSYTESGKLQQIHGDLNALVDSERETLRCWPSGEPLIPAHDLLCAGFPCQPFSKSGAQRGFADIRGTLFHLIAIILKQHQPTLVLLENVGNFARHDEGNTWRRVRTTLDELGYAVAATEHVGRTGGQGLLSPHHLGHPHHRERFFMVAQLKSSDLPPLDIRYPFPNSYRNSARPKLKRRQIDREASKALISIIGTGGHAKSKSDLEWAGLSADKVRCIDHWNALLKQLSELDDEAGNHRWRDSMPAFPIWGYELDPWNWYPYEYNPRQIIDKPRRLIAEHEDALKRARELVAENSNGVVDLSEHPPLGERSYLNRGPLTLEDAGRWVAEWPQYAGRRSSWPGWKRRFIRQNREWAVSLWTSLDPIWLRSWLDRLFSDVPAASNQKLEWNCKGEDLDLYKHILQFRPSGLRVKRLRHVPALVAMTTTQVPVVPILDSREPLASASTAQARHLIPSEALELQGFPRDWVRPDSREKAFQALGNAVHAGVVAAIVSKWLFQNGEYPDTTRAQRHLFARGTV